MKTTTNTRKFIHILVVLVIVGLILGACLSRANASDECVPSVPNTDDQVAVDCPPIVASPVHYEEHYEGPSGPTCDVVTLEELNVLQIRDAYHVDTIDELDRRVREFDEAAMYRETALLQAEVQVRKQAMIIRRLRSELRGR